MGDWQWWSTNHWQCALLTNPVNPVKSHSEAWNRLVLESSPKHSHHMALNFLVYRDLPAFTCSVMFTLFIFTGFLQNFLNSSRFTTVKQGAKWNIWNFSTSSCYFPTGKCSLHKVPWFCSVFLLLSVQNWF